MVRAPLFLGVGALSRRIGAFFADHLKGHVHDQFAVGIGKTTEEMTETLEELGGLTRTAPFFGAGNHALRQCGSFWRRFSIVEKLIHGNFQSPGEFLERLDAGDGMAIFDAGNVASFQPGAVFNISLREVLLFADSPKTIRNYHI